MTSRDREKADRDSSTVPWHNRTSTLFGASVAAVAAIAVLIGSVLYFSRQDEPGQGPLNYVEPTFSSASSGSSPTPTTTATITSTSPPMTTDINPDLTPSSTPESSSRNPSLRPPRTKEETPDPDDDSASSTTRNRPRTNVTRTLYPGT